jgi:MFS family permease
VDGVSVDDGNKTRALVLALLALACGHMLSTLLRTIPAISLDVMAADFATTPQTLAGLTSIYHFSFAASQIPVGAAMDRFGVRPVSLSLLIGTVVGAMASGLATGPGSFMFGQFLLGVATSGMLMCPMTLAAKQLSPARFGLWSGAILSIGNIGMLLSSSPLAFVVDHYGWRSGFWISAGFGIAVAFAVFALVPREPAAHADESSPPFADGRCDPYRPVASSSRPDRLVACLAGGFARAAGIVGRPVADAGQGPQPHRGRQ